MSEYFKAEHARANVAEAQALNGAYKKAETEEILANIEKVSRQGDSSITISRGIDAIVANRLRSLGTP